MLRLSDRFDLDRALNCFDGGMEEPSSVIHLAPIFEQRAGAPTMAQPVRGLSLSFGL